MYYQKFPVCQGCPSMVKVNQVKRSLAAHIVWATKYCYPVLRGDLQQRCRALLLQICDAEDVQILKGVVSKLSEFVRRMKGRTSRILQQEYLQLRK